MDSIEAKNETNPNAMPQVPLQHITFLIIQTSQTAHH